MKKKMLISSAILIASMAHANLSSAEEPHVAPIKDYVSSDVTAWLSEPAVIAAINAQNAKYASISEDEIIAMDNVWRAEVKTDSKPMVDGILSHDVSKWLVEKQEASNGLISEAFIMDAHGMNVAQSSETSDFWQGDEAKWQKTFLVGPDTVFVDEVEVDDSSGALQSQVSVSISDPATGQVIGAITLGINVDSL